MVHKVFPAFRDQWLRLTASSSPDTARLRMCPTVLTGLTSSTTATLCCMCRATKEHTDRTWVRRALVAAGPRTPKCPFYKQTWRTGAADGFPPLQVRLAAVCAGSAPCLSCSATLTTSATSPPATTTLIGCPPRSRCPCPWPPSLGRASSPSSAGRKEGRKRVSALDEARK